MSISINDQIAQLARRSERIISEQDLARKLERAAKTGKPLRIKLGMDPTAPDVTLGHAVPLRIVRRFKDWGHKAVIIMATTPRASAIRRVETSCARCSPANRLT